MGVHGLWKLIDPCGKPVPLESLENQILAVDISIWIHQAIKGFRDAQGNTLSNAHLLGIFHRLCKLLFYKIKPIIVFDGPSPQLKIDTIAARNRKRSKYLNEADGIKQQLLKNIIKDHAIETVISKNQLTKKKLSISDQKKSNKDDLFYLPTFNEDINPFFDESDDYSDYDNDYDSSASVKDLDDNQKKSSQDQNSDLLKQWNIDTIYEKNEQFKKLPIEIRHEILTEIKGARKQSSWKKLHEMPTKSTDFSQFQMKKLLKRRNICENMQEIESQMCGKNYTISELETILKDEGVLIPEKVTNTARIDSNENRRFIFIKDVQKAVENATKLSQVSQESVPSTSGPLTDIPDAPNVACSPFYELESKDANSEEERNTEKRSLWSLEHGFEGWFSSENEDAFVDTDDSHRDWHADSSGENKSRPIILENVAALKKKSSLPDAQNVANKSFNEHVNVASEKILSTDDESCVDDFIDVPADNTNNTENQDALQICVNKEVTFDEQNDIFADVFVSGPSENSVSAKDDNQHNKESTSRLDTSDKEKEVNILPKIISNVNVKDPIDEESDGQTASELDESKVERLREMQSILQGDKETLINQQNTNERLASNITDVMIDDAKELLKLFGIPFIDAQSEAEAQCAFLENSGVSNGTITDDSDIWLFGGKKVFKNFFNQSKRVLQFTYGDIEQSFKLSRHQLISLALLVGSDYTLGINGIGPVTALEILANFCENQSKSSNTDVDDDDHLIKVLTEFRKWFLNDKAKLKTELRSKLKKSKIPNNFPNVHVIRAYLEPAIRKKFSDLKWLKPNVEKLIEFTQLKFGWDSTKAEQILRPIIRRFDDNFSQRTIDSYFEVIKRPNDSISDKLSKRVKSAIQKLYDKDNAKPTNSRTRMPQGALKARLRAIETLRKSKGQKRTKKRKTIVSKKLNLSESSSNS